MSHFPRVTYPDDGSPPHLYSTFSHIATRNVVAAIDEATGKAQSLTLGASSNVIIDAANDVHAFMKKGGAFRLGDREATFMAIFKDPQSSQVNLLTDAELYLNTPVVHTNDLQVHGHFNIDGGIIGNNLNVIKYFTGSTDQYFCTGYGFRINERDELELVKYAMFDNASNNGEQTSIYKRIAIFGNGSVLKREDASASNNDQLPFNVSLSPSTGLPMSPSPTYTPPTFSPTTTGDWKVGANNVLTTNSKVGINVETPLHDLHVNGSVSATNMTASNIVTADLTFLSDWRLKTDVVGITTDDAQGILDKVMGLNLVRYRYNNEKRVRLGFIAQDVKKVMEDAVQVQRFGVLDDCHTIDTNTLLVYVVGALQTMCSKTLKALPSW